MTCILNKLLALYALLVVCAYNANDIISKHTLGVRIATSIDDTNLSQLRLFCYMFKLRPQEKYITVLTVYVKGIATDLPLF